MIRQIDAQINQSMEVTTAGGGHVKLEMSEDNVTWNISDLVHGSVQCAANHTGMEICASVMRLEMRRVCLFMRTARRDRSKLQPLQSKCPVPTFWHFQ